MAKTPFVDGNPSQSIPGTLVTAAFLNALNNHRHRGLDEDGDGAIDYAVATGGSNAYAITLTPALTAHVFGMPIIVKANHSNTGAATIAVDGLPAVAIKRRDGSDLVAGDIINGAIVSLIHDGTKYQLLSQDQGIVTTASSFLIENLSISASVAGNALTVAIKGKDGNNPSPTNPARIAFRKATLNDGGYDAVSLTTALSLALSAGSTLGFTANESGRLYVWGINNSGSIKIGLSRTADVFPEGNLHTSAAEGGSGGADSATTLYSDAAYAAKAIRCIGYIEITTGATAGNWTNAPSKIQLMGPGIKRTGDIIQTARTEYTSYTSTAATIPTDDTIPQNTEGAELMAQAITPVDAMNKLRIRAMACIFLTGGSGGYALAIFRDSAVNALRAGYMSYYTSEGDAYNIECTVPAGSTSNTTFRLRGGMGSGTSYFNGNASTRLFGGVMTSHIQVEEIFA